MGPLSLCHWNASGLPEAATCSVAACPALTVCAVGWPVICGAMTRTVTVSVASWLVTEPASLDTTTRYVPAVPVL